MSEQTKRYLRRIIPAVILIAGIIWAFTMFVADNAERIQTQNGEYLAELTTQRAASIDNLVSENLTFIQSTAYLYGQSLDSPFADVAVIRNFEENSIFDMLRFVDASGDNYTSKGVQANLADRPYFQAGMRGESGITYVLESRVTGEKQVGFYAPVYFEDEIIGVMVGFYGEEYLDKLLEYGLFGYGGEGWLCDADGTVLGSTLDDEPVNYFDYMQEQGRLDDAGLAKVSAVFSGDESASFRYREGGVEAVAYATPLTQTNWVLVRTFPPSAASQIERNANHEGFVLIAELVAMFAAYVLYMSVTAMFERRRVRKANQDANDIATGVSTLFDAFVTLDLDEYTYEYIGGSPSYDGFPLQGPYNQIAEGVLACIPEDDHREQIAHVFDSENMRAALMDADSISLRVHAPSNRAEWYTYNFAAIERKDGVPARLLVILQDVTDLHHKEVEEQLRLEDALDEAERASNAKTEFLFNMSHDLRTPMNAIIGYTELAQRPGTTMDEMRDFMGKIDASSVHLLALINDILEMSRIESGKITLEPEKTDLVRVMDEIAAMFSTQMEGKGLSYEVDAGGVADRWVLCDENRLNRVIMNLVSNALKFTPAGGHVNVTLVQDGRVGEVGRYELHVRDDGIGMSPDFVDRIFQPFERERTSTVSKTQGTGLGLSITKKIVDLMGGVIDVHTAPGEGTEFVVRLEMPVTEGEVEEGQGLEKEANEVDFRGKRILLAEDNAINAEIATMILEQYGFELELAHDGQEALDMVTAAEPGSYDVVLMDIQMPVMDGYESARRIRALPDAGRAGVPIVAMTANAFAEDVQAARDAGMNGHIAKPLDVEKMLATLGRVLGA